MPTSAYVQSMNYDKVLGKAVHRKWPTAELKEWWWTKFSAARRKRTARLSEAQNHRCAYCGCQTFLTTAEQKSSYPKMTNAQLATLEHVQPQSEGGTDHPLNCVMSCKECNTRRGVMDALEFYESRQDPKAWVEYLLSSKKFRQQLKEKKPEVVAEKDAKRARIAYNLAVACLLDPGFKARFDVAFDEFDRIHQKMAAGRAKHQANLADRKANLARAQKAAEESTND